MTHASTIKRFRDLSAAIVARLLLQSSGITAYLCDENLVRLNWQMSNVIGGIRLQVEHHDELEARELLPVPVPDEIDYGLRTPAYVQPRCPLCNSLNIDYEGSSRKAALVSLYFFALPFPFGPRTWSCQQCGNRWERQAQDLDS